MKKCRKNILRAVSVSVVMVLLFSLTNVGKIEAQAKQNKNIVILYFSATGTTKATAEKIEEKTGGKLIEIKAKKRYTEKDLDYGNEDSRVVKEHESAATPAQSKVRPEIANMKAIKKAVKKADVVYIGYPIWWGEAPHIVYTMVENVNLKGKTVIPFCTSISSGLGSSARHLKSSANISAKTKWLKGRNFYDVPSQKSIDKWIAKIKY